MCKCFLFDYKWFLNCYLLNTLNDENGIDSNNQFEFIFGSLLLNNWNEKKKKKQQQQQIIYGTFVAHFLLSSNADDILSDHLIWNKNNDLRVVRFLLKSECLIPKLRGDFFCGN